MRTCETSKMQPKKLMISMLVLLTWIPLLAQALEKTVLIRIVGTDSNWGQEIGPSWEQASPVKDAPGYSLYDLELGRVPGPNEGDSEYPGYLKLYKLSGYDDQKYLPRQFAPYGMTGEMLAFSDPDFPYVKENSLYGQFKRQSTLKTIQLSQFSEAIDTTKNSAEVLKSLKIIIDSVLNREKKFTRLILCGSPMIFVEERVMSSTDAVSLLKYIRQKIGKKTFILDFSTGSPVGYLEFAMATYKYADYWLASDKSVGGFYPNEENGDGYFTADHDRNMNVFWDAKNPIKKAFDTIISTQEKRWAAVSDSLKKEKNEQSMSIYKMAEFLPFMMALKAYHYTQPPEARQNAGSRG